MLKAAFLIFVLAWAVPGLCQDANQSRSLIPEGFRAIATPDNTAIILVSDPTNGAGKGLGWLGVGGAIACNADNSIVVWSPGYLAPPPQPALARPAIQPPAPPPAVPGPPARPGLAPPAGPNQFLWPEGVQDARPFDLDNSIIIRMD